ncbi:MAG: 2-C-methyl-D-erythritol 4-phosphate cytidylyltransferase [Clostridia bacterium]|nr:2-C-methyl-D-erythritol 4-phosphate cytidylyltransferase [Clostridia bacterium]
MATAIVLSGGTGTRFGSETPKQYLCVQGKPIIGYCLDTFQHSELIQSIVIVANSRWHDFLKEYIEDNKLTKFVCFAEAGRSRQRSIVNGLNQVKNHGVSDDEKIIIHDAARPFVTEDLIASCIQILDEYDCSMPVVSVKDTVYYSEDGEKISSLLNRDKLFAGQAPEGCHLGTYLAINTELTDDELDAVRGTSAIAFEKGLSIGLFPGSERNYKITTIEDYEKFRLEVERKA